MTIHPITTTQHLRTAYLDYLQTIKPFQDDALRAEFAREIYRDDVLVKGPMVQIALPYQKDLSVKDLVVEGILSPRFQQLCSAHLPYERPLYIHQVRAIRKLVAGRNLVVSTGTGSGKTETFLLPIFDLLLREEDAGTLSQPGVRALLLYPMNALANDQMKRLRRVLQGYPSITFGRYTGETQTSLKQAQENFRIIYPEEPIVENELICRDQIHAAPPHILLTNYAMLEYLLLRPLASPLFDGDTGKHWRFIVLDEAHVYDGANATEMSMLLRRVQERVSGDQHSRIQGIATSATIGRGSVDYPAVADFAAKLFNKPFAWDINEPGEQDVVGAVMMPISQLGEVWGSGTPEMYAELHALCETKSKDGVSLKALSQIAQKAGVPNSVILNAESLFRQHPELALNSWLYEVLRGDQNIHELLDLLKQQPEFLSVVSKKVFHGIPNPDNALVDLVDLAVMAKTGIEDMPLMPARYHTFARALEGAFICLNIAGHKNGEPRLFLHRQKTCPTCHSRVFELANCTRCGVEYLVGQEQYGSLIRDDKDTAFEIKQSCEYLTQDSKTFDMN